MTDSFVENISDWVTMLGICIGVAAWWFAREDANRKSDELERYKVESKERTAKLENDAAQARLELARIDPLNLPIKSLKADVFVFAKGRFLDDHLKTLSGIADGEEFHLWAKDGWLARLRCTKFSTNPMTSGKIAEDGSRLDIEGRMFTFVFEWPAPNLMDAITPALGWVDGDKSSTRGLDERLIKASLSLPTAIGGGEIFDRSCVLTINGNIRREFSLPDAYEDIIWCEPVTPK